MGLRLILIFLITLTLAPSLARAQCANPAGNQAEIIYNTTHNVPQYCDGANWIAMAGQAPEPTGPQNCPSIGDTCDDGSIYAGLSPDGNVAMYTTPADAPSIIAWNNGNISNFTDTTMANCTSSSPGIQASCQTGEANTALLISEDSDSGVGGVQSHQAASYCDGLNAHGHSDWYLPAQDELNLLYVNRNAGDMNGTFDDSGTIPTTFYWSSTEHDQINGRSMDFSTGTQWGAISKDGAISVRCVRRHQAGEGVSQLTEVVPDGLVGHWRLDETSGPTAFDSSGNGYDLTKDNIPLPADSVAAPVGTGFDFQGGAERLFLDDAPSVDDFDNIPEMTVTFWARPTAIESQSYVFDMDGVFGVWVTDDIAVLGSGWDSNGFWRLDTDKLTLNEWVHVAVSYSYLDPINTDPVIYINGQIVAVTQTVIASGAYSLNVSNLWIGLDASASTNDYKGDLDDVRIYDRILSADEIREIYEARDGVRYNESHRVPEFFDGNKYVPMRPDFPDVTDGLIAHWKLDETDGTTAFDSSGSGNDGIYYNVSSVTSIPGAVGAASSFITSSSFGASGEGTYALVPADPSINVQTPTIAGWVKFEGPSSGGGVLFGRRYSNSDPWNSFTVTMGGTNSVNCNASTGVSGSQVFSAGQNLTYGQWHHVACTHDGTNLRTYIDGVLVDTSPFTGPIGYSSEPFQFAIENDFQDEGRHMGGIDDVRLYDRPLSASEIQTLYVMGAPVGSSTALPQGCPNIGDVCDDGSIYAGLSPDGSVEMFTTPTDAPSLMSWNDGSGNFADTSMANCTDASPGTAATCQTGDANTAFLVGATGEPDYPFAAAEYCDGLSAHGNDDWYLPALDELNILYANRNTGSFNGTFNETGGFAELNYWTSSEFSNDSARKHEFQINIQDANFKDEALTLRCVRKGPAPRCANPYGLEGNMVYNTTHDVVQYCDGARWVAIGKRGP